MSFNSEFYLKQLFAIHDTADFNLRALELFRYQSEHVRVYREFIELLKINPESVTHFTAIPFLPVELFKSQIVCDQEQEPSEYFESSGTTGQQTSRHYVSDMSVYDASLLECFRFFYGDPSEYCFLALLPSYLDRSGSSLVYMMDKLIQHSGDSHSGFYLHNHDELAVRINLLLENQKRIFLVGVTYALLDFFNEHRIQLSDAVVMETGGMKGKRRELVKAEVHKILSDFTGLKKIHSEYGMTELLSQSYSKGDGIFTSPPWMKILIKELHDPFSMVTDSSTGTINVIDLMNIHSCAFIETQDLGRESKGSFEVLGRMDQSELRGCNLMIG